jgi:hypothetical protein
MCVVAVLIGDKGDSGAPFDFIEGGGDNVRCSEQSKGFGGGRGKLSGMLEWGEAVGREKEIEGEEGGSSGLSSGRRRATQARGEGKFGGLGSGTWCEGGL